MIPSPLLPLFLALIPPAPQSTPPPTYVERFAHACKLLESGALQESIEAYRSCLELAPESPTLALHLSRALARQSERDEALAWLERAIDFGFLDGAYLDWEQDFASLRGNERFERLANLCRGAGSPPSPAGELRWRFDTGFAGKTPDGERVLTWWLDDACLWDTESGELIAIFSPGSGFMGGVALDPSGKYAVTSTDRGVCLWDSLSGKFLRKISDSKPGALQFGAHGSLLLCQGSAEVELLEFPSGQPIPLPGQPEAACLDQNSRRIVLRWSSAVQIFEPPDQELAFFDTSQDEIVLRKDGKRAGLHNVSQGSTHLLDVEAGRMYWPFFTDPEDGWLRVTFDPSTGELVTLLSHNDRGGLELSWWSEGSLTPVRELAIETQNYNPMAYFAPQGGVLLVASYGEAVRGYDSSSGELLWEAPRTVPLFTSPFIEETGEFAIQSEDDALVFIDARTGEATRRLGPGAIDTGHVRALPDGKRACTPLGDGTLRVFDIATGERIETGWAHERPAWQIAFGKDGTWMVSSDSSTTRTWDLENDAPMIRLDADLVLASPADDRLLVEGPNGFSIVSVREGLESARFELQDEHPWPWTWSPDGRWIAVVQHERAITLIDSRTGEVAGDPLEHAWRITEIAFDASAQGLFTAGESDEMYVWEFATREHRTIPLGPDAFGFPEVADLDLTPDGKHLVLCRPFGIVQAWNVELLEWSWTYESRYGSMVALEMRPGSRRIYLENLQTDASSVLSLDTGQLIRNLDGRDLARLEPSPGDRWLLASRHGATVVLDGEQFRERYARADFPDGGELRLVPSLYCQGTPDALATAQIIVSGTSQPLDSYAAILLDPRRVQAGTAGVHLRAPELPTAPEIVSVTPEARHVLVEGASATLHAVAEDPRGLVGFQIEIDRKALAPFLGGSAVRFEQDGRLARFEWSLERPPSGKAYVRLRAIGRTGVLSRPVRVTFTWK